MSRPLSDALDEVDPIQGSYVLEVGSAGAERALKKPEHFAQCMGQEVDVKLYRPRERAAVGNSSPASSLIIRRGR